MVPSPEQSRHICIYLLDMYQHFSFIPIYLNIPIAVAEIHPD